MYFQFVVFIYEIHFFVLFYIQRNQSMKHVGNIKSRLKLIDMEFHKDK